MFRVTLVRTQIVAGQMHHHVRLYHLGTDRICGVLQLLQPDWAELLLLAEREHFEIEVATDGPLQTASTEDPAPE